MSSGCFHRRVRYLCSRLNAEPMGPKMLAPGEALSCPPQRAPACVIGSSPPLHANIVAADVLGYRAGERTSGCQGCNLIPPCGSLRSAAHETAAVRPL